MKSPLSVRGNGISSASRPIGQIRAVCPTQKVNHPWVKPLILCASGKVIGKGSIKAEALYTISDLCIDLAFEISDAGIYCDGSKHRYLFDTLKAVW